MIYKYDILAVDEPAAVMIRLPAMPAILTKPHTYFIVSSCLCIYSSHHSCLCIVWSKIECIHRLSMFLDFGWINAVTKSRKWKIRSDVIASFFSLLTRWMNHMWFSVPPYPFYSSFFLCLPKSMKHLKADISKLRVLYVIPFHWIEHVFSSPWEWDFRIKYDASECDFFMTSIANVEAFDWAKKPTRTKLIKCRTRTLSIWSFWASCNLFFILLISLGTNK